MSSKMLEEAIVDAEALKEAALKSAQEAVLERYAPQVKKAIQMILEQEVLPTDQEEDPLAGLETDSLPELGGPGAGSDSGLGDLGGGEEDSGEEVSQAAQELPLAATEGDKLCACPDEEEEIEINFDELEKQMATVNEPEDMTNSMFDGNQPAAPQAPISLKLEEEIDVDEDVLSFLLEESEPATKKAKVSSATVAKSVVVKKQQEKREGGITFVPNKALVTENKEFEKVRNELLNENKKIKNTILDLTKRMEEVNLSNAKLLYTNQALTSNSLNERQKTKIVEAISKADSIDDVKLVYETLEQTVGSVVKSKESKSLNEMVINKNGLKFPRRTPESSNNPVYTRMQEMAGIVKK